MMPRLARLHFVALLVSALAQMMVCALVPTTASAATQSNADVHVASALAAIAQFEKTHAVPDLETALKQLELASAGTLGSGDREKILAGYLKLFGAIDRATPHLTPGAVPAVNVVPPKVNGVTYPAGVDPSAIPDPAARARYQQELRANDELTDQYIAAMSLHRRDKRALSLFSVFARGAFGKSSADRSELRRQVEQSDLTSARKNKLLAVTG